VFQEDNELNKKGSDFFTNYKNREQEVVGEEHSEEHQQRQGIFS